MELGSLGLEYGRWMEERGSSKEPPMMECQEKVEWRRPVVCQVVQVGWRCQKGKCNVDRPVGPKRRKKYGTTSLGSPKCLLKPAKGYKRGEYREGVCLVHGPADWSGEAALCTQKGGERGATYKVRQWVKIEGAYWVKQWVKDRIWVAWTSGGCWWKGGALPGRRPATTKGNVTQHVRVSMSWCK